MRFVSRIFDFYINASIHVAFAVMALVGITLIELEIKVSMAFWTVVFFGTISGYNFVKYMEIIGSNSDDLSKSVKSILIFSLLCFVTMLFFSLQLSLETLSIAGVLALLTFFYAVPMLNRKNLRNFGSLKIFIVALVWTGVTVLLPVINSEIKMNTDCWITFVQRFFIVLVLTLPFEIRDLSYDVSRLKTLPQQLGIQRVKTLGIILLMASVLLEGFKDDLSLHHFLSLVFVCLLIGIVLIVSETKQHKYFAAFWVESIPIVWLLSILFLIKLF